MNANTGFDLSALAPAFAEPVFESQSIFRRCLEALARPGTVVELPGAVRSSAKAALLALLDQDTRLWLSPGARCDAAYYRFHTGCGIVEDPARADFALIASADELPPLAGFAAGSDEYPERSATLVVEVEALRGRDGWRLTGPGIRGDARLGVRGLGSDFVAQWRLNRQAFPRGVDLLLSCGALLAGLPRTVAIEA